MEANKEVTITRIINAPRELVFKAWTDPDQFTQWWMPNGFTNRDCKMDVRPGGAWEICSDAPGFPDHWIKGMFIEIAAPEKLVFTSTAFIDENGIPKIENINTVTFEEQDGKTKLTLNAKVTKHTPDMAIAIDGMEEGWSQTVDKLGKFVSEPFVTERVFNAPMEIVWKAITDRDEMKKWYFDLAAFKPEVGFEFQFVGGRPERQYTHLCKVTEVIPGRKITYSWRYDGYEGNSFVTFELFAENRGTKLRLSHVGIDTFPAGNTDFAKHNFAEGWTHIVHTSFKDFLEK